MDFLSIPDTSTPCAAYPPSDPAISYTFSLDPFQQHAVAAIHRGDNVLVTAKTGSGKTMVGEYQIAYTLAQGKRVFYTTPIKSLSNQKFHDLKHLFPRASVGIMTGDIKSNPEADIVVMTAEILRNLLFKQSTSTRALGTAGQISLDNVGAVVMDEIHYIQDADRGHVWEETLVLLDPDIRLILLSATIDSPELFASWLGRAKQRPIVLLKTTHRVVPLVHGVYDPTVAAGLPLQALKAGDEAPYKPAVYKDWLAGKEQRLKAAETWAKRVQAAKRAGDSMGGAEGKVKLASFTHSLNECVNTLQERDLLPALFFQFSRKECERYAAQIQGSLLDSNDVANVKHIVSFHLHRHMSVLEKLPQYHQIIGLIERGIAFHHSGLLPLLKEIVELLFGRGFIKVLFCTETFAVGLNMPARTVVFLDLKKPGKDTFRPLRPDEYIQMAGRAGRRGKDKQGVVIYMPARQPIEPEELRGVLAGALVPLESRLQFHYDFVLKALHASASDGATPLWSAVVDNSYWNVQRLRGIDAMQAEHDALEKEIAALPLSEADLVELDQFHVLDGRVKASANAARKKAQAELDRWKERHTGPRWAAAQKHYAARVRLQERCIVIRSQLERARTTRTVDRVQPVLDALRDWGALESDSLVLTDFGVCATECNEGNPLLMAKLYASKRLAGATAEEIVGTLAALIVEKEAEDKSAHPADLPPFVSKRVYEALLDMEEWAAQGTRIDRARGVDSPENFWKLTTLWTMVGIEWMTGTSAAELAVKYEMFEGNLMRGLLKLANLVEEWTSVATYKADVEMLETLKHVYGQLVRDLVQPESLYLRL